MIYTILILLTSFALFAGYLVIRTPVSYWLKWFMIPLTLILALYLSFSIPDLMGRAYPHWPKDRVEYLDHAVISDIKGQGKHIEMWMKSSGKGSDKSTRLYSVPFSSELAKELDDAKAARQQGIPTFGKFGHGQLLNGGNGGHSSVPQEQFLAEPRVNPHELLPNKDINNDSHSGE